MPPSPFTMHHIPSSIYHVRDSSLPHAVHLHSNLLQIEQYSNTQKPQMKPRLSVFITLLNIKPIRLIEYKTQRYTTGPYLQLIHTSITCEQYRPIIPSSTNIYAIPYIFIKLQSNRPWQLNCKGPTNTIHLIASCVVPPTTFYGNPRASSGPGALSPDCRKID